MNTKTAVKIIVLIIILLGLYYVVSALGAPELPPEDMEDTDSGQRAIPQSITLSPGESGSAGDVLITLHGITEDSRCPVDVACIQAGKVTASTTLEVGNIRRTVEMSTDSGVENIEGYMISIERVHPANFSGQTILQEDYEITFVVSRDDTFGGVSWEDAVALINTGDVETAAILHSGQVNLILENGETVVSRAPSETEFFAVIEACGAPCADMAIAME